MMIDDIKKVLALCANSFCDHCPYDDIKDCYQKIKLDDRDLIIKQESEIERLHQEVRDTDKMARNIIEQYKNAYNKAFERLKAQPNAEILARGVRDLNHENYGLTEQVKQAQIEEIAKFDKPCYDYNKLLYIIRCNMTSITRYIRNENEAYDIRYKKLAEKAVENILKAINHRGEAEALYNAGYGNISEYKTEREMLGSQIKVLKKRLNNKYVAIERLKAENEQLKAKLEARLTCDFVEARQNYAVQDFAEREVKKARKETAKEILILLGKGFDETKMTEFKNLPWYKLFCRELKQRYGVEVEE